MWPVLGLFAITIFTGAALLFLVQPMMAKHVLPLLGGSPAVWNTCMVFFQGLLLAGYAYAHASVRALGVRRQVVLHLAVASVPGLLWVLGWAPIEAPTGKALGEGHTSPVVWLLLMLAVCVGPAFFVLSTCATLMQRWFAGLGHRTSPDPYFLYAASNAGSMLALLAYPLLVEPRLSLSGQRTWWSAGYVVLLGLTAACAAVTLRRTREVARVEPGPPPTMRQRAMWVALAAAPSSLLIAVTQYLSTDIAAAPLLWVVPLALYLLTFILAFSRRWGVPLRVSDRTLPVLAVSLAVIVLLARHDPIWLIVVLNLAALFFGGTMCHGRLAAMRPPAGHLTDFYLCLAIGGVLGGLFNAVVAPVLFDWLAEYPIALAAVCMLRTGSADRPAKDPATPVAARERWAGLARGLAAASIPAALLGVAHWVAPMVRGIASEEYREYWRNVLLVGVPVTACYMLVRSPVRFGAALGAVLLLDATIELRRNEAQVRTFFGVYAAYYTATPKGVGIIELRHGTTLHGARWVDDRFRSEPLVYYHRRGPIGDVFRAWGHTELFDRVALVGLGTGSIASYGRPGQTLRFFEIDPAVVKLATQGGLFHFIGDSKAVCEFVIGDARLSLAKEPDASFGAIVLDAFSSDAVPVHLLTREALGVYLSKLRPGGVLALHVSNRYLDLERVVAGVAGAHALAGLIRDDSVPDEESKQSLHWSSTWIVLARNKADLTPLLAQRGWHELPMKSTGRVWTDDYSSVLGVFEGF